MKTLFTGKMNMDGETYILGATEVGLAYFDRLENAEELPKFFKDFRFVEDFEKIEPYALDLKKYFQQQATSFSFPLDLVGTPFQKQVWQELLKVPYGQTTSYSALAQKIGRPTAYRAVANAVGRNPILVVVPCHRVLGKDGSLTGFRGGLPLKRHLLAIEGQVY